jgi:hypothetical protein
MGRVLVEMFSDTVQKWTVFNTKTHEKSTLFFGGCICDIAVKIKRAPFMWTWASNHQRVIIESSSNHYRIIIHVHRSCPLFIFTAMSRTHPPKKQRLFSFVFVLKRVQFARLHKKLTMRKDCHFLYNKIKIKIFCRAEPTMHITWAVTKFFAI